MQAVVRDLVQLYNDPAIDAGEHQRILRAPAVTLYHYDYNRPREHKEPSVGGPPARRKNYGVSVPKITGTGSESSRCLSPFF